ncbi:hypothetical protein FHS16_005916 [Paenibacillus endophyticus]|uniref:Uncharacterized protein n=1 Tax=Paenibacillus endophyticus TaxID=1294268 RepID=A0A7W5GDC5_9BACL|nr:hypothetical protein [Paenibacillus endophyticus]MBB3155800.1 hypothetical protein [Paenibacillus endophyticus]
MVNQLHWKKKMYNAAIEIANGFSSDDKILGVSIGGRINRGET